VSGDELFDLRPREGVQALRQALVDQPLAHNRDCPTFFVSILVLSEGTRL
jgi:hypothetical protein